jgi:hypothetical protein
MASTSAFGWETPDDTDLVKDGAAAIRTLGNSIDTSMSELKGGTTGQVLSKTSATDMDFTWVTSDDANAIQNAIVDAKGDLIAASAADTPARLAVGANGETLVADSSTSTGLKWQADTVNTVVDAKGDLLAGTADNTIARRSIGVNGTVLTADSAEATGMKWAAISAGGAYVLIKRASTSGAVSTGTTFDDVFTSTYKAYKIVIESWSAFTGTDDALFQLRYAGPTTQTASYYGGNAQISSGNSISYYGSANTASLALSDAIGGSWGSHYEMTVTQVGNTSEKPSAFYVGNRETNQAAVIGSLYNDVARTYTGFILSSASNISVTVAVYGLATA